MTTGLRAGVADRGEGAGDQCHHLLDGDIAARDVGCVRALQQVCDMAREVCRDVRSGSAHVELGGRQRALHRKMTASEAFERWQREVDRSRAFVAAVSSLGVLGDHLGQQFSLRYVLLHMIEEYARHNGHADLLRERLDGVTGE